MPNESRLNQIREEAWAKGVVTDRGVDVAGGPIPRRSGYYGQPVVRPPVWTWEIPIYFFVGGFGGMSAVIALGALLFHHSDVARTAMWLAAVASVLSPILLILDLGRPHLFLHMLRVFKPQSAMSMVRGSWRLSECVLFQV
jgi:formate-dependent nitrite reductase membrane component NrfD